MSTHLLPIFRQNATIELDEMLPIASGVQRSLESILKLCQTYRIRAICTLFLESRVAPFVEDLHKSGRAMAYYLLNASDSAKATAKAAPLF